MNYGWIELGMTSRMVGSTSAHVIEECAGWPVG